MSDGCGVELVPDEEEAPAPPPAPKEVPACACGEPSKYRCPGCGVRTCSLLCVKKHKVEQQCSGKRDAATFCDIKSFDDRVLMRDYALLESVGRSVDSSERGRKQMTNDQEASLGRHDGLTPARRELLKQAQWRVKLQCNLRNANVAKVYQRSGCEPGVECKLRVEHETDQLRPARCC